MAEDQAAQAAAAATAAARNNDKAVRLGEFDGDKPPFNDWVAHVQMCKNATEWSEEFTAQRAQLMLKGKAAVWLQNQVLMGTEGLDVWFPEMNDLGVRPPNLRSLLEARFSTTKSPTDLAQLRSTLQQKDSEDVNTFFDRVQSVQFELDKVYPLAFRVDQKAAYTIVHDQGVFNNFLCGLRADIRTHVTTVDARTVTAAKDAALAFEQGSKAKKARVAAIAATPNANDAVTQLSHQVAALASRIGGQGAGRGRGAGRGGSSQASASGDEGYGYCLYCGYIGHSKPKCNIRKKDEAQGLHYPQSPYFAPNRVGRGRGRGVGGGRGGSSSRGQVSQMGEAGEPWPSTTSAQWSQAQGPTMQPQAPGQTQQQQQFQQQQQQQQQPNYYNPQGGAAAFCEPGAFRFFPAAEPKNQ